MIKRVKYLNKVLPFVDKPLIKVITGIRRSGKSTLLKQIIEHLLENGINKNQIISINKELFEFDSIKTYSDLHSYINRRSKDTNLIYYLFIDEIQLISEWEKAVNSFLAEEKYDIYISGSNTDILSSDLATLIAGRYIEIKMYVFTFSEFVELSGQKQNVKSDLFAEYLKYGGFPGLHNLTWQEDILRQYLEAIYNTIVLKDVITRNGIKDAAMLNNILEFISSNCGNITTAKNIRDFNLSQNRKVSNDTVINYLHYAMNALLIHKVKRYDLIGKRILETYEKYYLADIGLSLYLTGNNPAMISGKLENVIFIELLSRGYSIYIGKIYEKEVDFVAEKNNEKIYIQVSTTLLDEKVQKREYDAFINVPDHFTKYVLSLDKQQFTVSNKGVKWMNIIDFLLADSW